MTQFQVYLSQVQAYEKSGIGLWLYGIRTGDSGSIPVSFQLIPLLHIGLLYGFRVRNSDF